MYSQELLKPDGRKLTLYSRYPIAEDIPAPSPGNEPLGKSTFALASVTGRMGSYAGHRQGRIHAPQIQPAGTYQRPSVSDGTSSGTI